MRLSTHKAITRAVACAVGVRGGPLLEAMLRGVEEPDRNPEEEIQARVSRRGNVYLTARRVRHHTAGNRGRIMKRLWKARRCWLKGRPAEAAFHLGYALHYIQDACVSADSHGEDEARMQGMPVPLQAIDAAAAAAKPSPSFLEQALSRIGPSQPRIALENASVASALAAAAVLAPPDPPSALVEAAEAGKPRHRLLVTLALSSALAGFAAASASIAASMLAFAAALAFYAMDGEYRKLRKELKWFSRRG